MVCTVLQYGSTALPHPLEVRCGHVTCFGFKSQYVIYHSLSLCLGPGVKPMTQRTALLKPRDMSHE